MMKTKRWFALGCAVAMTAAFVSAAVAEEPEKAVQVVGLSEEGPQDDTGEPGIRKVYTINHSYGDGQKVSNVVVEYNTDIDADSLSIDTYEVKDRTIVDFHTNDEVAETAENVPGKYVVLDLEIQSPLLDDKYATDGRMQGMTVIDSATVVQKGDVTAADGTVIAGSDQEYSTSAGDGGIMGNDAIKTPDMDRFEDNHYYNDPETHTILHYNLYKPEGYADSGEEYPLVLFIPDASAVGTDWEIPLQQGNGGTIWASEEWQAEHPCFVVTMIYEDKYINDYWEFYEDYMYGTMRLLYDLADKYPVDSNRIYTTGQSMGCMASMVMMEHDPDLFAGAYIMAGQWDEEQVKDIKDQNILLLVSEDDPAVNKLDKNVAKWKEEGGVVAEATFDGIADQETRKEAIDALLAQDANIYYLKIASGTGSFDGDGNALNGSHRMTFRIGYDLPSVKEWLFEQTKDTAE